MIFNKSSNSEGNLAFNILQLVLMWTLLTILGTFFGFSFGFHHHLMPSANQASSSTFFLPLSSKTASSWTNSVGLVLTLIGKFSVIWSMCILMYKTCYLCHTHTCKHTHSVKHVLYHMDVLMHLKRYFTLFYFLYIINFKLI